MSESKAQQLGIEAFDFVEFYVGSGAAVAAWHARAMGLPVVAYTGPETGQRDRVSYVLGGPQLTIVITAALGPDSGEIQRFVQRHGDGVRRWAIRVKDAQVAFDHAVANGAVPSRVPLQLEDDGGIYREAALRVYDSAELVFVERGGYSGGLRPGFGPPPADFPQPTRDSGLSHIDHIVGNVRKNEMDRWADYYEQVLGFERFIYFGPGDISTEYSSLLSRVMRSPDGRIRLPINEPHEGRRKSQIQEYIEEYHGSGIQHVALATRDILQTVEAMRSGGVRFLNVPDTYYDALAERADREDFGLTEDIADLRRLGILCDVEGEGYLLQLFTQPVGDRPTFFYEVIQRRQGARGFGQGNFQALFESIEAAQGRRGNL